MLKTEEDISEYKFAKFAATYFQAGASTGFIKRPLKEPLLDLRNENDRQVGLRGSSWLRTNGSVVFDKCACSSSQGSLGSQNILELNFIFSKAESHESYWKDV